VGGLEIVPLESQGRIELIEDEHAEKKETRGLEMVMVIATACLIVSKSVAIVSGEMLLPV
jgi:hypothetical protein